MSRPYRGQEPRGQLRGSGQPPQRGMHQPTPYNRPSGPGGARPAIPAIGQTITVRTNCFQIKRLPDQDCVLYKTFQPECKSRERRQEVFQKLQNLVAPNVFGRKAFFDGRDLAFCFGLLQLTPSSTSVGSFTVNQYSNDGSVQLQPGNQKIPAGVFNVTLTMTGSLPIKLSELGPLLQRLRNLTGKERSESATLVSTATNVLQMIIRQETDQKYPHYGSSFFMSDHQANTALLNPPKWRDQPVKDRHNGLELWKGFFQSVKPTLRGMVINVDVSMTAMYTETGALDSVMRFMQLGDIKELVLRRDQPMFQSISRYLDGVRVHIRGAPRRVRVIRDLEEKGAMFEFTNKEGRRKTVRDYFVEAYSQTTRYPTIVAANLSKPGMKPVIVPLELCTILPGQMYKKRLPSHLTSQSVTFGTTLPEARWRAITGQGRRDGRGDRSPPATTPILGYSMSPYVIASNMDISSTPLEIQGTILAPPRVTARTSAGTMETSVEVRNGAWNYKSDTFYLPMKMSRWCLIDYAQWDTQRLHSMIMGGMVQRCRSLGMDCAPPAVFKTLNFQGNVKRDLNVVIEDYKSAMKGNLGNGPPLFVVILPESAAQVRHALKYWGDVLCGIPTQCIRTDKLASADSQYWANVAQKLNSRLGGTNGFVESEVLKPWRMSGERFMLIGADVTHPPPNVQRPSYAGLAWSCNEFGTHYRGELEPQDPRVEHIRRIGAMVVDAVKTFASMNKGPPKRIIFFRDGLSDAEFTNVGSAEMEDIMSSLKAFFDASNAKHTVQFPIPTVTYIFVVKRHHIKFFPTEFRESPTADKKGNVRAGFVTSDENIHHPRYMEFYLQAHSAIQGTARSARHLIFHDDNFGYSYDRIERLSFDLCHVYATASRSISLPAPVYYADKICDRAQYHYDPDNQDFEFGSEGGSHGREFDLEVWRKAFKKVKPNIANVYYL